MAGAKGRGEWEEGKAWRWQGLDQKIIIIIIMIIIIISSYIFHLILKVILELKKKSDIPVSNRKDISWETLTFQYAQSGQE